MYSPQTEMLDSLLESRGDEMWTNQSSTVCDLIYVYSSFSNSCGARRCSQHDQLHYD